MIDISTIIRMKQTLEIHNLPLPGVVVTPEEYEYILQAATWYGIPKIIADGFLEVYGVEIVPTRRIK